MRAFKRNKDSGTAFEVHVFVHDGALSKNIYSQPSRCIRKKYERWRLYQKMCLMGI